LIKAYKTQQKCFEYLLQLYTISFMYFVFWSKDDPLRLKYVAKLKL